MVTTNLSAIINSRLLKERINSSHLSDFLESQSLYAYRQKTIDHKLDYLLEKINIDETSLLNNSTTSLYSNFIDFLCHEAKYTTNRIIVTIPVAITTNSPLDSVSKFEAEFPNHKSYNNIASISDTQLEEVYHEDSKKYIPFFEEIKTENNQIVTISKGFVKKKKQLITDDTDSDRFLKPLLDFVWVDICPQKELYRIHFSQSLNSTKGQLSFREIYEYFSDMINNLYNIIPASHDVGHVLYKIYKSLTDDAESPYTELIEMSEDKIDAFLNDISSDIGYSDTNRYSIDLNTRLKKLLERALIQQDFDNYINMVGDREGFVDKFQFKDPSGARVHASAKNHTYDMRKHDIYFDTKESIDLRTILNALWVTWFKTEGNNLDRIKVKYTIDSNYYVTHFLSAEVNEEVFSYVLQKFEKYKNQQLD